MKNFDNKSIEPSMHHAAGYKRKIRLGGQVQEMKQMLREYGLNTGCQSAGCPNIGECFRKPTATFMILGTNCTRHCRFCGVKKEQPVDVDPDEPARVAGAVKRLGLKHVVITSVTRDDLEDGGAFQFAQTIRSIRKLSQATIEVLVPDFQGNTDAIDAVLNADVDVFNHNIETVPELYPIIRPEADYQRSLSVLAYAKKTRPALRIKSGLMVGLGETENQVVRIFSDLASIACDMLTIGQYLNPSRHHYPVQEIVSPLTFHIYRSKAIKAGIPLVFSGPHVRSSYHADEWLEMQGESS